MPTPKSTPARTRFEPPSPKAKVSPATTIATSERPRAMVLVNACCKTLTAFSQGELPPGRMPARQGTAPARETRTARIVRSRRAKIVPTSFHGHTSAKSFASRVAMRGKSTRPIRTAGRSRNALVRRHARLTPDEPRPLRLDATQQQRSLSRELPSIYLFSVWKRKMCRRRKKILLRDSKGSTLSAEQDKLDAFSIPNLDSKAT